MHAVLARLLLLACAFPVLGCGGSTPGAATLAPQADTTATNPRPSGSTTVDINGIFPPGPGRDLVLNTCQNCHNFVPIVILQMDKDAWRRNSLDHRERVANLPDDDFRTLYEYLAANFGPHRPVPELPRELLESWTSY